MERVSFETKYSDLLALAKRMGIKGIRKKDLLISAINALKDDVSDAKQSPKKEVSDAKQSPKKEVPDAKQSPKKMSVGPKKVSDSSDFSMESLASKYAVKTDLLLDIEFPAAIPYIKENNGKYYSAISLIISVDSPILGNYNVCGHSKSSYLDVIYIYNITYKLELDINWNIAKEFMVKKPVYKFSIMSEENLSKRIGFVGEDLFSAVDILEKIVKGDKPEIPIDINKNILSSNIYENVISRWNKTFNVKRKFLVDTALIFLNNFIPTDNFFADIYNIYGDTHLCNMAEAYLGIAYHYVNTYYIKSSYITVPNGKSLKNVDALTSLYRLALQGITSLSIIELLDIYNYKLRERRPDIVEDIIIKEKAGADEYEDIQPWNQDYYWF